MIEKLKEYKELISLMLFFLGGFIWADHTFPKKDDLKNEISYLNCQLDKYMELTQYQMRNQSRYREVNEKQNYLNNIASFPNASPAMVKELESEIQTKKKEIDEYIKKMSTISDELQKSVCWRSKI